MFSRTNFSIAGGISRQITVLLSSRDKPIRYKVHSFTGSGYRSAERTLGPDLRVNRPTGRQNVFRYCFTERSKMSPIGADTDTVYVTQHICKNERTTVVLSQRKVEVNGGFSIKSCQIGLNPEGNRPACAPYSLKDLAGLVLWRYLSQVLHPEENESKRCRIQGR